MLYIVNIMNDICSAWISMFLDVLVFLGSWRRNHLTTQFQPPGDT